jgi:hypothetical protein
MKFKRMKNLLLSFLLLTTVSAFSQTLVGKWQMMKKSDCMTEKVDNPDQSEDMDELMSDFNSLKSRTPEVIEFKDKMKGEQNTTILGKRKTTNDKTFMYRFDGTTLHLLDKKSKTITASYTVQELTDSKLILEDANRPCEVRVFERIQ